MISGNLQVALYPTRSSSQRTQKKPLLFAVGVALCRLFDLISLSHPQYTTDEKEQQYQRFSCYTSLGPALGQSSGAGVHSLFRHTLSRYHPLTIFDWTATEQRVVFRLKFRFCGVFNLFLYDYPKRT